jgi:DNA-binding PadR family transcriptional regulator
MPYQQHSQRNLSQPALLILSTLKQRPSNGVGLCEAIQQMEGLVIEPATLYRALAHLEQRGWIEGDDAEAPLRVYRLTAPGRLALGHAEVGYHSEQPRERWHPLLQRGKELIVRFVIWMLCLYPLAWRERYEQEMIALLEQHELTLWTVLDLFLGALDARLDPHYRRKRQLLPLLRLQVSWKWFFSAVLLFCFSLLFWSDTDMWGADFPCNGDAASCTLAHTMGVYNASLASTIEGIAVFLMCLAILPFLLVLLGWIGLQARRTRDLLRILPVALFVLLCLLVLYVSIPPWAYAGSAGRADGRTVWLPGLYSLSHNGWFYGLVLCTVLGWMGLQAKRTRTFLRAVPVALLVVLCLLAFYVFTTRELAAWLSSLFHTWWFMSLFLAMLLACVVLMAESAGTMFISLSNWQKRHHLFLATLARLFALLAIAGMVGVCIATGAGLVDLWNVLPLLNEFSLGMWFLPPLGFIMMVAAIVIACVALVRSTLQLRAASTTSDNTSALLLRERTGLKNWIIVLPAVAFVYIELTSLGDFGPFGLLLIPPLFVLGSVLLALAVKQLRVKGAALAKQEPLSQVQQVHEHN